MLKVTIRRYLDGDGDGCSHVVGAHKVGGAQADARPAQHIHGVVDDHAPTAGALLLHDGRDDRGLLVLFSQKRGQRRGGEGEAMELGYNGTHIYTYIHTHISIET